MTPAPTWLKPPPIPAWLSARLSHIMDKDHMPRDRFATPALAAEMEAAEKDGKPRHITIKGTGTITARVHNVGPRTLWLSSETEDDEATEHFPAIADILYAEPVPA